MDRLARPLGDADRVCRLYAHPVTSLHVFFCELCVLCGESSQPHPAVCTFSRQAKLRLTIERRAAFSGNRCSSRSMDRINYTVCIASTVTMLGDIQLVTCTTPL